MGIALGTSGLAGACTGARIQARLPEDSLVDHLDGLIGWLLADLHTLDGIGWVACIDPAGTSHPSHPSAQAAAGRIHPRAM